MKYLLHDGVRFSSTGFEFQAGGVRSGRPCAGFEGAQILVQDAFRRAYQMKTSCDHWMEAPTEGQVAPTQRVQKPPERPVVMHSETLQVEADSEGLLPSVSIPLNSFRIPCSKLM